MKWIFLSVLLAGSGFFAYREYGENQEELRNVLSLLYQSAKPERPAPAPMMTDAELARLRETALNGDSRSRWASLQTLHTIKDSKSLPLLERAMAEESDPEVRTSIVSLIIRSTDPAAKRILALGVNDANPDVRAAAIKAVGEAEDLSASALIVQALNDDVPEVKLEAMNTMTHLERIRRAKQVELSEQLQQYGPSGKSPRPPKGPLERSLSS